MEKERFDKLTKTLARRLPRRSLAAGLAAGAGGLLVAPGAGAAICRAPGVLCAKDAHCCSGICGDDHRCSCPEGLTACGQTCIDTATDAANCGGCGISCDEGVACQQGQCGCPEYYVYCPSSQSCIFNNCPGAARNVYDPTTCDCICDPALYITMPGGGCGVACTADTDCNNGGTNSNFCGTTEEGLQLCVDTAVFVQNPNCETSYQCYHDFNHGINTVCVEGICRGSV